MGELSILHGRKRFAPVFLICFAAFMGASNFFVMPIHAEGYVFISKWGSSGPETDEFWFPQDVAVDDSGNVYVADTGNHRILKFDGSGTFLRTWDVDRCGTFSQPAGIAVRSGVNIRVYVADAANDCIQKFDDEGTWLLQWGDWGNGNGEFWYPTDVAVDDSGNVYVADTNNHRILKFDSFGNYRDQLGHEGTRAGEFRNPRGVAVDDSGNVYVADSGNDRIQWFDGSGTFLGTVGHEGTGAGEFRNPTDVAVDGSGNVYVVDYENHRIQKIRIADSFPLFLGTWGSLGSDDGEFRYPSGVAFDGSGDAYVVDSHNNRIQKFRFDSIPPTTNISLSGTVGNNNWYTSNVTVTLTATDDLDTEPSTTYAHVQEYPTPLIPYLFPFTITSEGTNTLRYSSVDEADNTEEPNERTIRIDKTPPIGSLSINEGATNTTTPSVNLNPFAHDEASDVAEMCFSNNGTTWNGWEPYAESRSYTLTPRDGPKTVYVKFRDNAGLESPPYNASIVLDTLQPSIVATGSLENGTHIRSSTFEISWSGDDHGGLGIDRYMVRQDNGSWESIGTVETYEFTRLSDGSHTFEIKAVDQLERESGIIKVQVVVNTSPIGGPGYLEEGLIGVAIAAAAVGLVVYKIVLPWRRKPRLRIQAEPKQIFADGKSKSTISVQLQDRKGKPMEAAEDIGTTLTAKPPLGRIENPKPSISKGKDSALTSLVSPKDIDEETKVIELLAVAEGLKGHKTKITLLKLSRYCMGCGTKMSVEAQREGECEICGAKVTDFRGTPLWTCKECTRKGRETHNPFNAKFCPECGAGKPGKE